MVNIEQNKGYLNISYIGTDGDIKIKKINIPNNEYFNWDLCYENERADKNYISWDEKPIKKVKTNYLNRYRIEEFLSSLNEDDTNVIYSYNSPHVWYCDIEVEITDGFPEPSTAINPIISITLFDSQTKILYILGLKPFKQYEIDKINTLVNEYISQFNLSIQTKYLYFDEEIHMIYSFLESFVKHIPFLTGWYFEDFDWKYIINRCKRLNIDYRISSTSRKTVTANNFPQHKIIVDYMKLYKKYDKTIELKENYKLETAAKQCLGIGKVKYAGGLKNMYDKDPVYFMFYNSIDSILIYLINEKLNVIDMFIMLNHLTRVEIYDTFYVTKITEFIMVREFYKRNKIVIYNKKNTNKKESYEGAYVMNPQKGLYKNVAIFDFTSLYPTTIRQFNISPETYIGKNIELKPGYVKCENGAVFNNNEDSIMRIVLTNFFNERVQSKHKALEIYQEISYLKNNDTSNKIFKYANLNNDFKNEIEQLTSLYKKYKNQEQCIKILINSLYGIMGANFFYFYNTNVAEAVSLQGQSIMKYCKNAINIYFLKYWHKDKTTHEKMELTKVEPIKNEVVIYGDTDSNFICFDEVISKTDWNKDTIDFILKLYDVFLSDFYKNILEKYAQKTGTKNFQKFEMEKILSKIMLFGKKSYFSYVAWEEPNIKYTSVKKIYYKGTELAKSTNSDYIRHILYDCIEYIMNNSDNFDIYKFNNVILKYKKEFKLNNIENISLSMTLSSYENHVLEDKYDIKLEKKCPIHVRAAAIYNYMLFNSNYKDKYEFIKKNDKVKYYYVKKNQNVDVFAFHPGNFPIEFAPEIDYNTQFDKLILTPLNRFISAVNQNNISNNELNINITKDLFLDL